MNKHVKKLLMVFILAIMPFTLGAKTYVKKAHYKLGTLLDGVALNAAAATRTFTIGPTLGNEDLIDYDILVLELDYSHNNNGTITTTCLQGQTVATANKYMTTCTVASGTCTLSFGGVLATASLSTDKKWSQKLGIDGAMALSCTVSHGGAPDASDLITVTGYVVSD